MRDETGREVPTALRGTLVVNDPRAMREAAALGLGVGMLAMPDVLSALETRTLVRLLPRWYVDAGVISVYHASRRLLPLRTRAFVDWIAEAFKERRLSKRFTAAGAVTGKPWRKIRT